MGHTTKAKPKKTTTRKAKAPTKPKYRIIEGVQVPTNLPSPSRGRSISKANKIKIASYVCKIYALDKHPLDAILPMFNVGVRTFYGWLSEFAEIAQLYKESQEEKDKIYFSNLRSRARTALERKVSGEVIVLKTRKYRTPTNKEGEVIKGVEIVIEETEKEVYMQPSDTAIIYALNNQDGGNFTRNPEPARSADKSSNEYDHWTDDQLDEEIKRLEKDGF